MIARSLGYVKVATPGTPVSLSTVLATLGLDANLKVHKIEFWPLLTNTGATYVGLSASAPGSTGTMNKSTGAGVLKQVQTPSTGGHQDLAKFSGSNNENSVRVADFAVDATNSNDGFAVFTEEN